MSNEEKKLKKPWYKKPTIMVPIIVAIMGVIGAILASYLSAPPPPPPDFSILVKDVKGEVQKGGVIPTTVTVTGISSQKHPVSLRTTEKHSGIVVTFVPPSDEPTPSYISTVTISVESNVPANDYDIIIKGTGADGKERSCTYTLTVKPLIHTPSPTSVTPTPTHSPTPTPPRALTPTVTPTPTPPFVDITRPEEGEEVACRHWVKGNSSATKDTGLSVHVLTWPIEAADWWWVQPTTTFSNGSWQSYAYFGECGDHIGTTYKVVAIITGEVLRGGDKFRELPDHVAESGEIIVTRI